MSTSASRSLAAIVAATLASRAAGESSATSPRLHAGLDQERVRQARGPRQGHDRVRGHRRGGPHHLHARGQRADVPVRAARRRRAGGRRPPPSSCRAATRRAASSSARQNPTRDAPPVVTQGAVVFQTAQLADAGMKKVNAAASKCPGAFTILGGPPQIIGSYTVNSRPLELNGWKGFSQQLAHTVAARRQPRHLRRPRDRRPAQGQRDPLRGLRPDQEHRRARGLRREGRAGDEAGARAAQVGTGKFPVSDRVAVRRACSVCWRSPPRRPRG